MTPASPQPIRTIRRLMPGSLSADEYGQVDPCNCSARGHGHSCRRLTTATRPRTTKLTFNVATNTWTSLAPLPTARDYACFGSWIEIYGTNLAGVLAPGSNLGGASVPYAFTINATTTRHAGPDFSYTSDESTVGDLRRRQFIDLFLRGVCCL